MSGLIALKLMLVFIGGVFHLQCDMVNTIFCSAKLCDAFESLHWLLAVNMSTKGKFAH